ncbi:MAG: 50S ribosomal protein L11 methyltransferase [Rhodospirillales bacterium]|nr:50S ribosomal protein L11 methyltransferase [Rhodospirillales bacterium]
MTDQTPLWRVQLSAGPDAVEAFGAALEPLCDSVSWIADGDDIQGVWTLNAFLGVEPDRGLIAAALASAASAAGVAAPEFTIRREQPRDWLAENMKSFPPRRIGRFFIIGTRDPSPVPEGVVELRLNPGAAFGSGEHATTAGCLMAIDAFSGGQRQARVLDMGCGSGILSLGAAKSCRAQVVAADSDPKAVAVSRRNMIRNKVHRQVRTVLAHRGDCRAIRDSGPYDLIVSNILARPLRRMARTLSPNLRPGGVLVLSGFLIRDAARVAGAYRPFGLRILDRIDIDGWRTLVLVRS